MKTCIKNITKIAFLVTVALTFSACRSGKEEVEVVIKPATIAIHLADDTQQGGLKDTFVRTTRKTVFVHNEAVLTTADIVEAYSATETVTQARVEILMTPEASKKFTKLTAKHAGQKRLAVFIDGRLLSAPQITSSITNGRVKVTEIMPMAEATALAKRLKPIKKK